MTETLGGSLIINSIILMLNEIRAVAVDQPESVPAFIDMQIEILKESYYEKEM